MGGFGNTIFAKGLIEMKGWYEKGTGWKIGNGSQVRFWHDVWLGECPLEIVYPIIDKVLVKDV